MDGSSKVTLIKVVYHNIQKKNKIKTELNTLFSRPCPSSNYLEAFERSEPYKLYNYIVVGLEKVSSAV